MTETPFEILLGLESCISDVQGLIEALVLVTDPINEIPMKEPVPAHNRDALNAIVRELEHRITVASDYVQTHYGGLSAARK